jgi:hypothetical protein
VLRFFQQFRQLGDVGRDPMYLGGWFLGSRNDMGV